MKKMMIIAAALVVAGMAQAASLDWAITGLRPIKDVGNVNPTQHFDIYLVMDGYQAGITAAILDGTFTAATAGVLDASTTTGTQYYRLPITATHSLLVADNTPYSTAVLVFATPYDDTPGSPGYYQFSALGTATPAYVDGVEDATTVVFAGGDFNAGNWTAYNVVPEPTSMALLALGVAAIGLRRRFTA